MVPALGSGIKRPVATVALLASKITAKTKPDGLLRHPEFHQPTKLRATVLLTQAPTKAGVQTTFMREGGGLF